jgi:undecaprenyl-diphosphatase
MVLPLSAAISLVEFPTKAFFRRRRPFIAFIQAIVIGKKPGSWSFPSGHSASAFAGAWLFSHDFPNQSPLLFLMAALVGFSRIYLGDHYPGDVLSGALSGMALAESIQQAQQKVMRMTGNDIG